MQLFYATQFRYPDPSWGLCSKLALDIRLHGENDPDYRVDRGLRGEAEDICSRVPMGRLEDNIAARLAGKRQVGDRTPVTLLTLGPGKGILEAELKLKFGSDLTIDTFGMTNLMTSEPQEAIRTMYLGAFDTHKIPQGYDLIVSLFGTTHAVDQNNIIIQVMGALNAGGEACYHYAREIFVRYGYRDLIPYGLARSALRVYYGVLYGEKTGMSDAIAYMKVERPIANPKEALIVADTYAYDMSKGGVARRPLEGDPFSDSMQQVNECLARLAEQEFGKKARDIWSEKEMVGIAYFIHDHILPAGFSIGAAVHRMWDMRESQIYREPPLWRRWLKSLRA